MTFSYFKLIRVHEEIVGPWTFKLLFPYLHCPWNQHGWFPFILLSNNNQKLWFHKIKWLIFCSLSSTYKAYQCYITDTIWLTEISIIILNNKVLTHLFTKTILLWSISIHIVIWFVNIFSEIIVEWQLANWILIPLIDKLYIFN